MYPWLMAYLTRSAVFLSLSLFLMFARCWSTVRMLIERSPAICGDDFPSATNLSTSRSRVVRDSLGTGDLTAPCPFLFQYSTMVCAREGDKYNPPWRIFVMAKKRSVSESSFRRYPSA